MTLPDLIYHNPARFSLISCVTDDSVESAALATPLDASPPPPPSNTFSIINIVNDDPLPNLKSYPAIASTYTRRRRAQTSPRPVPSSIMMDNIPQQQPTMIYDSNDTTTTINNDNSITLLEEESNTYTNTSSKLGKFWPRIKRMMMSTTNNNTDKMKQLFESMNLSNTTNNDDHCEKSEAATTTKLQAQKNNKRWLGRNRSKIGPQR